MVLAASVLSLFVGIWQSEDALRVVGGSSLKTDEDFAQSLIPVHTGHTAASPFNVPTDTRRRADASQSATAGRTFQTGSQYRKNSKNPGDFQNKIQCAGFNFFSMCFIIVRSQL